MTVGIAGAAGTAGGGLAPRARGNLLLLAGCQALGQAANTMMFAATALSVVTFYDNRDLATLPMTMQHLGIMLWVFPASLLMQRIGRRAGFMLGAVVGLVGAGIVGLGLYLASFVTMCLGAVVLGYAVANVHMYRFAAVELVPGAYRAQAISWVTAGGVVAGIIGPGLVRWSHDQILPLYLMTYAVMAGLHLLSILGMAFIRFPAIAAPPPPGIAPRPEEAPRPLRVIAAQPRFVAAVLAAMVAYGAMAFLMGASPLAIVACGLPHAEAHWVLFLHVMGMFVPSFFTGSLIARYGTTQVMLAGVAILALGIVAALMGESAWHFRISMTLNGVGWNFVFVGATTLVTTCYRLSERGKVQALNDFMVFGTTALATFLAGFLQERLGWYPLNWFGVILCVIMLGAVVWLRMQREPAGAAG